jgi:hypothetical protein
MNRNAQRCIWCNEYHGECCPSPEEIRQVSLRIRASWNQAERRERRSHLQDAVDVPCEIRQTCEPADEQFLHP